MRTFILRLWVDPAGAGILRGVLQPLPEGDGLPFADEQTLLALLHQMLSLPKGPEKFEQEEER